MNQSRYAILGMLTIGPMTGYDIKNVTDRSLSFFWSESYGNIYPRLRQLEAEGLTRSRVEKRPGAPNARVHTLTPKGRASFEDWLVEPAGRDVIRSELLLKVFYGASTSVEQTVRHIESHRADEAAKIEVFYGIEKELVENAETSAHLPYWRLSLRRGRLLTEARIRWCDEALDILRGMAGAEEGDGRAPSDGNRR